MGCFVVVAPVVASDRDLRAQAAIVSEDRADLPGLGGPCGCISSAGLGRTSPNATVYCGELGGADLRSGSALGSRELQGASWSP